MEVRGAAAAGGVAHCGAASDTRTGRAGCGLGYPRSVKPFLVATAGWTIAALLMLIFVGDGMDNPGCGVGEVLQGACERQLAAANSERFANATLPLLLTIAAATWSSRWSRSSSRGGGGGRRTERGSLAHSP